MNFNHPVTHLIRKRISSRTYQERAIDEALQGTLIEYLGSLRTGPLGNPTRFELVAASQQDARRLQGLGTYGFIKNAAGFIAGALRAGDKNLEDFGYQMELAILFATDLGLGTCWLGGTFTKSRFAQKISLKEGEIIPAVTAIGYVAEKPRGFDHELRRRARSDQRRPWEKLFFEARFGTPLSPSDAGRYAEVLEMVRLAPSASNRQPWRIVKDGSAWHIYLQRTPGYRHSKTARLLKLADLQRVDMGIAMCHFEQAAREVNLEGVWRIQDPALALPDELTEYTISWVEA